MSDLDDLLLIEVLLNSLFICNSIISTRWLITSDSFTLVHGNLSALKRDVERINIC